jgi:hypothetical protein
MTRFEYYFRYFPAMFLILVASPALAEDEYLGELSLNALFPGQYEAQMGGRHKAVISANHDGKLSGRLSLGWYDKGRWWIKDDSLCIAWSVWTSNKPVCSRVRQEGEWYTTSAEGKKSIKFKRLVKRVVDNVGSVGKITPAGTFNTASTVGPLY